MPTSVRGYPQERTDVSCDGVTSVIDVVKFINVAFRNADPVAVFCDPCVPRPSHRLHLTHGPMPGSVGRFVLRQTA